MWIMKKQLEQYFGCEVEVSEYKGKLQLPIFMTMRRICLVELVGVKFALVDIAKESELTIAAMKKQQTKYEEALQCPVAYEVAINSLAMRNGLVKNGVSFIDMPENIFLPFVGIVLQDVYKKKRIRTDKMMPATQMVFLELMYMDDNQSALKSEIAGKLNLTRTSITRATAQLKEMGLILQSKSGTEISIRRNMPRREYYEKAKEYLINPVQKVITVMRVEQAVNMWCAGETALSKASDLNPPRVEETAIYKGDETVDQFEMVDERLADPEQVVRVQLWKYNPFYFAKDRSVDVVSLACSFIGNEDERIEMSIEELLEEL
jgi:DNA-binding MarR family transcriptional regulator